MGDNKPVIDCNLIVDDDFMNKDVSELVQGDFYLFCVKDNKTYLYKDGRVGVAYSILKVRKGIILQLILKVLYKNMWIV